MERDWQERKRWLKEWQPKQWSWLEIAKGFIYLLVFVIFLTIISWIALIGLQREEQRECYQWQEWAQELKVFYLTPSQKEQCDRWGIQVEAPVKNSLFEDLNPSEK